MSIKGEGIQALNLSNSFLVLKFANEVKRKFLTVYSRIKGNIDTSDSCAKQQPFVVVGSVPMSFFIFSGAPFFRLLIDGFWKSRLLYDIALPL